MKYLKNFSKFTAVGIVFYFAAIVANGLLIEWLEMPAFWSASGSLCVLFVFKYFASVWCGIIHRDFMRYTVSNIALSMLSAILIAMCVDWLKLDASLSTAIVLGVMFVLRWLVLSAMGLLKIEDDQAPEHPWHTTTPNEKGST